MNTSKPNWQRTPIRSGAPLALAFLTVLAGSLFGQEAPKGLPKHVREQKPIFDVWYEEVPTGQVVVAMDGAVLVFKGYNSRTKKTKYIAVKRSGDGGETWSEEAKVGDMIQVDGDMSDDGRYPNNNWTNLGNVMVDEVTGDIMVFLTTLKTAQKLFRSKDHGKIWKLEDTVIKPGKDGWMPATNWPVHRLIKKGPGNYTWLAAGRKGTPSEGMIYLLAGKDWMARFNLAWLVRGNSDANSTRET